MKRSFTMFILILFFTLPAFSRHYNLGQFYDGEAKPREEVAWVWCFRAMHIMRIDNNMFSFAPDGVYNMFDTIVVELLPGKHSFLLTYNSGTICSQNSIELQVDVKAGENYELKGNIDIKLFSTKNDKWNPTIEAYSPEPKSVSNLSRKILCPAYYVDGVISSWGPNRKNGPAVLVLSMPESNQTKEFITSPYTDTVQPSNIVTFCYCPCYRPEFVGKKVRVFYFPCNKPENAELINQFE
jgi:hypothetical protein